jgi:hypothetical protein
MTITPGAILLGVALLILVLLFVARPLLLRRANEPAPTSRQTLQAQKDAYLEQIADLDFDHETGKLPESVYERERRQLLIQAALILRQLDTLGNGHGHVQEMGQEQEAEPAAGAPQRGDAEAQIEQAIMALRQQRMPPGRRPAPAPNGGSRAYCPHCGTPVRPNDNFCRSCGHSLRQQT